MEVQEPQCSNSSHSRLNPKILVSKRKSFCNAAILVRFNRVHKIAKSVKRTMKFGPFLSHSYYKIRKIELKLHAKKIKPILGTILEVNPLNSHGSEKYKEKQINCAGSGSSNYFFI